MRVLMVSLSMLALAACGGRQVEVRTGPEPATDVAIQLTNNLSQAVNVYVVSGGNDIFVKQVAGNSVERRIKSCPSRMCGTSGSTHS